MPAPPREAVSLVAQVMPAPPRSWIPLTSPSSRSSRHASKSLFSSNGSPTCTLGRLSASLEFSSKPVEARTLTPPIPSLPVADPNRIARFPTPLAFPSTSRSVGSTPIASTFTNGLPLYVSSKTISPPTVGTPTLLPYPETPLITPSAIHRLRGSSRGPNRSGSITAMGLAPIVKISRRMPPTPVAAPW